MHYNPYVKSSDPLCPLHPALCPPPLPAPSSDLVLAILVLCPCIKFVSTSGPLHLCFLLLIPLSLLGKLLNIQIYIQVHPHQRAFLHIKQLLPSVLLTLSPYFSNQQCKDCTISPFIYFFLFSSPLEYNTTPGCGHLMLLTVVMRKESSFWTLALARIIPHTVQILFLTVPC